MLTSTTHIHSLPADARLDMPASALRVLRLYASRLTVTDLAWALGLSTYEVCDELDAAAAALGAEFWQEAVARAREQGALGDDEELPGC